MVVRRLASQCHMRAAPSCQSGRHEKLKAMIRKVQYGSGLGVNNLPGRDPRPPGQKLAICVQDMGRAIDLALEKLKPADVILVAPCSVNAELMRQPCETDVPTTKRRERNVQKGYDICQPILAQLETAYRKLAAEKGVRFVSLLNVVSPENLPDGLHPNDEGQRQIAAVITPFLLEKAKPGKLAPARR